MKYTLCGWALELEEIKEMFLTELLAKKKRTSHENAMLKILEIERNCKLKSGGKNVKVEG
jgi:hypothetical protein